MTRRNFLGAVGAVFLTTACSPAIVHGHASHRETLYPELPGTIPAALNPDDLTTTPVLGIDTSRWQMDGNNVESALLDIRKFKADGGSFQFSKATQGLSTRPYHRDRIFKKIREHAANQDLLFGAYHFLEGDHSSKHAVTGDKQALQHLEEVSNSGPLEGILYALDVEYDDNAQKIGPSYEDVLAYWETFYKYVHSARLMIYTAQYYWGGTNPDGSLHHGYLGNPPAPKNTELWAAEYISGNPTATLSQIKAGTARPHTPDDPWIKKGTIGTWPYPVIRQVVSNGLEQQFQDQLTTDGKSKRVLDLDGSFYPLESLKKLAGL